MIRWYLMIASGLFALAVFYPMAQAALAGDTVALVFTTVVALAILSNIFATRSWLRKHRATEEPEIGG